MLIKDKKIEELKKKSSRFPFDLNDEEKNYIDNFSSLGRKFHR